MKSACSPNTTVAVSLLVASKRELLALRKAENLPGIKMWLVSAVDSVVDVDDLACLGFASLLEAGAFKGIGHGGCCG